MDPQRKSHSHDITTHTTQNLLYLNVIRVGSVIAVPQEHAYAVNDERLPQLNGDASVSVPCDGVRGIALLSIVVLGVSVQQSLLHLTFHRLSIVLRRGNVFFRDYLQPKVSGEEAERKRRVRDGGRGRGVGEGWRRERG